MMYKALLITTLNVLLYTLCSIIMGFFFPTIISLIASMSKNVEFTDCFDNYVFWVSSMILTMGSLFYLNEECQIQKP